MNHTSRNNLFGCVLCLIFSEFMHVFCARYDR